MTQPKRTITVGIGDQGAMRLLDWVSVVAHPGDTVHIVHAYDSLPYAAVDWQLPVDNDDLLYAASARHVSYAALALRRKRPDLAVGHEIVRCPSARALSAAANEADLIVVGSPHRPGSRSALRQLAQHSTCPVLVVGDQSPLTAPEHAPVTVMLRDLANDEAVVEAGFEAATERRSGLIALRAWQPQSDASLAYAEAEEQLAVDLFLAAWMPRFPDVGVSTQLRVGDACSVLREYAGDAALLVLGNGPAADSPEPTLDVVVDTALQVRHAPTLLIPSSSPRAWLASNGWGKAKQPVSEKPWLCLLHGGPGHAIDESAASSAGTWVW
jgi:nucleotide-binding universal stress UspA family protein